MVELRDQEAARSGMADLDNAKLLGFEWLEPERDEEAWSKEAGLAFNKRGLEIGEGPPPPK